jgi:hypothetical protein
VGVLKKKMLLKYLVPIGGLVVLQLFLNQRVVDAKNDDQVAVASSGESSGEISDDLQSAELFLRPVVVKYGHDHPGVYTWQGGSGVGNGWGVYQPKAQVMMMPTRQQGGQGWGWGKEKKKKVLDLFS